MGLREQFLDFRDRFQESDWREKLNRNQKTVTIVCGVIIAISLLSLLLRGCSSSRPTINMDRYYYNTATGEIFTDDPRYMIAPVTNRKGEQVVYANVFSCASCEGRVTVEQRANGPYVAYLSKYSEELKEKLESMDDEESPMYQEGMLDQMLIAEPDGEDWFPQMSAEAEAIKATRQRCESGQLKPCF